MDVAMSRYRIWQYERQGDRVIVEPDHQIVLGQETQHVRRAIGHHVIQQELEETIRKGHSAVRQVDQRDICRKR